MKRLAARLMAIQAENAAIVLGLLGAALVLVCRASGLPA